MTEEEWQIIRGVYKEADILAEVYAPQRSDSTKDRWRTDASNEEKSAFFKWYATAMTGHPDAFHGFKREYAPSLLSGQGYRGRRVGDLL